MTRVSDSFSWDDMSDFTAEDMDNLLRFYESGEVPTLDELLSLRRDPDIGRMDLFDGSFGFSVGA